MIRYVKGDIFSSPAQVITNTVNLEGFMGKGIALEFKKRYPQMFNAYKNKCESGDLKIGNLMLYRDIVLKNYQYLEKGLQKFVDNWDKMGIDSIAFPALGCGNGGLLWKDVRNLMEKYLKNLPIDILIYTDSYFDNRSAKENISEIEKMLSGEAGLEGYELFRHRCISYIKKNGEVVVDDEKKWSLSADGELLLDSALVDENELIHMWNYIRNVKVISKDDAERKDSDILYPLLGLMREIDYSNRIYVSNNGEDYTKDPNAYMFNAA